MKALAIDAAKVRFTIFYYYYLFIMQKRIYFGSQGGRDIKYSITKNLEMMC